MASLRRAVVVGIDKYQDSRIPGLYGARNDAEELCDKLRDYGKFEVDSFLDEQADYLSIRKAVSDLLWRTDKQDLSLFYFSGHGFQDDYGYGYMAPWDLAYDEPLVRGLRMQEIKDLLLKAKNKEVVLMMLDCCYSGIAAEGGGDKGGSGNGSVNFGSLVEGMGTELAGAGRIILASSGKDQKSREKENCVHSIGDKKPHYHGAFTFELLEALDGAGATAQGFVTLADLQAFIDAHMDPARRPSYFSSSLHDARNIVIAEASQMYSINASLLSVKTNLDQNEGLNLFLAVDELSSKVLPIAPNLEDAKTLKGEINAAIDRYRTAWIGYLQANTMSLVKAIGVPAYQHINDLVAGVSFDSLKDGATWGILGDLCSVSQGKMNFDAYVTKAKAIRPIESPLPAADRTMQSLPRGLAVNPA